MTRASVQAAPTLRSIVIEYCRANGFHGLFNPLDGDCCCVASYDAAVAWLAKYATCEGADIYQAVVDASTTVANGD